MPFHIVTSKKFDFEMFAQRAQEDTGPRHTYYQLAQRLNASIHQPEQDDVTPLDWLLTRLCGEPAHWALARRLMPQLSADDVVYCAGEDVGLPLAFLGQFRLNPPRIAMYMMAPERFRTRHLLKQGGLGKRIHLLTVAAQYKADYLQQDLAVSQSQIFVLPEQTDTLFFRPGDDGLPKPRPLVVSAGLEQRDYATLARAVAGKAVDVKVCAVSPNASAKTRVVMPEHTPDNMEMRYFEFLELRQLYRSADVVAISLLENRYSAGLSVLLEAMACQRPVVVTRNEGAIDELIDAGLVLGVERQNPDGLWEAIHYLLQHPQEARAIAQKAYQHLLQHYTYDHYLEALTQRLQALAEQPLWRAC